MLDLVSNYEDKKEFEIDIPQSITETLNKLFDPSKSILVLRLVQILQQGFGHLINI